MQLTLAATVVLVMMVVFLFLRRAAPTAAAGVTVPLSLSGTCAAMWAAGFSIDNLSLMALAVSVGFVVDDAIVMIENVFRYLEAGVSPLRATLARRQTNRLHRGIDFGLADRRLHSAAVHGRHRRPPVPRIFGDACFRHRDFHRGVAVGDADDLRLFRARSRRAATAPGSTAQSRAPLSRMVRFYDRTLSFALEHRALTLIVFVATIVAHHRPLYQDAEGLFPAGRHRAYFRRHAGLDRHFVRRRWSNCSSRRWTSCSPIPRWRASVPRSAPPASTLRSIAAVLFISLKPLDQRGNVSTQRVVARLRDKLNAIPGIRVFHGTDAGSAGRRPPERFAIPVHAVERRHR